LIPSATPAQSLSGPVNPLRCPPAMFLLPPVPPPTVTEPRPSGSVPSLLISTSPSPPPPPPHALRFVKVITDKKLQAIPLGGLGEFGMNIMALRYGDDILVID